MREQVPTQREVRLMREWEVRRRMREETLKIREREVRRRMREETLKIREREELLMMGNGRPMMREELPMMREERGIVCNLEARYVVQVGAGPEEWSWMQW
jgi:hypothetical protein